MNLSFFLSFATFRMRSSACDTVARFCARSVLCWFAFPLASALCSTGSAAVGTALFVGFPATMAESDFSRPCIIGYGSSPSRCGPATVCRTVDRESSRFPRKERLHMPGSLTTPGHPGARADALGCVAFHHMHGVGTLDRTLSRLNVWPMRSPVNASPRSSRATAHDSGPMWIAIPSSQGTCTLYSSPVSRRFAYLVCCCTQADVRADVPVGRVRADFV